MVKLKKINNHKVKPLLSKEKPDTRPILGADLIPLLYATILTVARKKSGKTQLLLDAIRHCITSGAMVHAYVATLHNDPTWTAIREWCDDHGVGFDGYTSMYDDEGRDRLQRLVNIMQAEELERKRARAESQCEQPITLLVTDDEAPPEVKERKAKYQAPERLFIFDDLSDELKSPVFVKFLKEMRHYKAKVLIGTQHLTDLPPGARTQIDYWMVFKGLSEERLTTIHTDAHLPMSLEDFFNYYQEATNEPFSFLYIDVANGTLRKRFDQEFLIEKK